MVRPHALPDPGDQRGGGAHGRASQENARTLQIQRVVQNHRHQRRATQAGKSNNNYPRTWRLK